METPQEQIDKVVEAANEVLKETEKPEPKKPKAKKSKHKPSTRLGEIDIDAKHYEDVILPDKEDDPHWDPKLKNPVPEGLVKGLAEFGWDASSRAVAIEDTETSKLKIIHGKTRWRALPKANAIRKSRGEEPIVARLLVVDESPDSLDEIIKNMRLNVRLNRHVQDIDPMTLAESMLRNLSAGIDEKQVADDHSVTINELHGYLLLTDEDKCPPAVQELLREGKISFGAALELAKKAGNLTKSEVTKAAEEIAKISGGGLRVTAAQVKKAAGVTEGTPATPATNRQKKQLILDLQSAEMKGKHGEACQHAAIIALEVGIGTRTIDDFWEALDKIGKGHTIRMNFKQYAEALDRPVKGQEKSKK